MPTTIETKALDQITEADLQALVDEKVPESRRLDFKAEPYPSGDKGVRELLKDVVGLANAAGGIIVFGVEEEDRVASGLRGITEPYEDIVNRYTQSLRSVVEPSLYLFNFSQVPLSSGGYAIILEVPVSLNAPHRVTRDKANKFYIRSQTTSDEMTMGELRQAFLGGATREAAQLAFRRERLEMLSNPERSKPVSLKEGARLVLHIMPQRNREGLLDVTRLAKGGTVYFHPLASGWGNFGPNFDGFVYSDGNPQAGYPASGYTLVFHNGVIETVVANCCCLGSGPGDTNRYFLGDQFGSNIISSLQDYFEGLQHEGVRAPVSVALSATGLAGTFMNTPRMLGFVGSPCDRDVLLIPPVIFESLAWTKGTGALLRPIFDRLWQAFGIIHCPYLDNNGCWVT